MNAPQGFITATETRSVKTPQGRLDASASQASTAPTKASKSNSTGKSLPHLWINKNYGRMESKLDKQPLFGR